MRYWRTTGAPASVFRPVYSVCRRPYVQDVALTRLEKEVSRLRAEQPKADPELRHLMRLADLNDSGYIGLNITVAVAGKMIQGTLMGEKAYAEYLDGNLADGMRRTVDAMGSTDPLREAGDEWANTIEGEFKRLYTKRRDRHEEHSERLDEVSDDRDTDRSALRLDDLPDDLAADNIELQPYRPAALTLDNAVLLTPPIGERDLGVVRILVSQIGAWWLAGPDQSDGE